MLATLKVESGKYKVKVVNRSSNGIRVKMMEDAPFAEQGETQFVAERFLIDWNE